MLKTMILAAGLILGGAAAMPQGATAAPLSETAAPAATSAPTAWAQYGYYGRHRHWGPPRLWLRLPSPFRPALRFPRPAPFRRHRHWGHRGYGYGPRGYYRGF